MQVSCSAGIDCEFPDLRLLLNDVKAVVREVDRDLRVRGLFVETRLSPSHSDFNGWAHPDNFSVRRNNFRYHPDGWVQMSLGFECGERDIIRLFAHELRHISQFNRGKKKYGTLTINPLSIEESEDDAYDFELRVLDLM